VFFFKWRILAAFDLAPPTKLGHNAASILPLKTPHEIIQGTKN
jgi:hypothetical protein